MKFTSQFKNTYKVIKFSIPISASILVNMLASFFSLMMVGRVGKVEMAAAAIAVPTFMTIMTSFSMVFYSIGILISHSRGRQTHTEIIGKIVKNGFCLAIMLMIPSGIILWNMDSILILFHQSPLLVALTPAYFHFAALAIVPTLIGSVIAQFFIGTGRTKFILISSLISLPITLLLSYAFIFGNFGFHSLGLAGVSCAIFLTQSMVYGSLAVYLVTNKKFQNYQIFSGPFLPEWPLIKKIFALGYPIGCQFGGELAAMTAATYLMGFFGVAALAANQIVGQYSILVIMIMLGLSQGISVLMSEAYSRNDVESLKEYTNSILIITTGIFLIVFSVFSMLPELLINLYLDSSKLDSSIMSLTCKLFLISSAMIYMDGLRNVLCGGLRGLQDSKLPMRIGVLSLWLISLPISYIVAFGFDGGPLGLRAGFISGYIFAATLLWVRIRKKINLIGQESTIGQSKIAYEA